ncbi:restriction endonuclease subunit S [Salinicola sp. 4072]|uniref:restriction endonuclease subunit S n=1 Tax=Salinicola sp. 4072 TaxID=3082157 RepID=UPI002FC7FD91
MFEWEHGSLGELAYGVRGVSYTPNQLQSFMSPETVILLRSNNIRGGKVNFENIQLIPSHIVSKDQLAQHKDIAVCMSNGSKALVGKSGRIERKEAPCTVGAFCSIFRPLPHADGKFVSYLLQSNAYRRHLDIILAGSAINNLKNSDVEAFPLEIPPKEEQRLIAHILDTLDTQIQKTEALIAKLEKVKEGLLHDLLTRGIDEHGQLRPSPEQAPALYKGSRLGLIPREWECIAIDEMAISTTLGTANRGAESSSKIKLIKMGNLNWENTLSLANIENISASKVQKNLFLHDADLLFNTRNTPELVGKTCSWKGEGSLFTFDNNILRIRFSEIANGHFVATYMGASLGKKRIGQLATGTTSVAAIYWRSLAKLEIPMPNPREQQRIMKKVSSAQNNVDILNDNLTSLYRFKSGIMDDLLTGRVRVTPLLEKVQATTPA